MYSYVLDKRIFVKKNLLKFKLNDSNLLICLLM